MRDEAGDDIDGDRGLCGPAAGAAAFDLELPSCVGEEQAWS